MSRPQPSRQALAVARLTQSRARLRRALIDPDSGAGQLAMLSRLVQRHPWIAATLALGVGALFARARPWRWLLEPRLWSALLPSLVAALAGVPVSGWFDLLAQMLRQVDPSATAPASTSAPPPPPPSPPGPL
jgi:hypothetical protein